jgi:hypothetical protein
MKVAAEIGGDRLLALIDTKMAASTDDNLASAAAHHTVGNNNR